jgi:acetyltransferase-like isoleucine patch superfamily enzyme
MRWMGRFAREIVAWADALASCMPGRLGYALRRSYFKRRLGMLGPGCNFAPGIRFLEPGNIYIGANCETQGIALFGAAGGGRVELGDRVTFAPNVVIDAGAAGLIRIGNDSGVAHNCVLRASSHKYDDPSKPFKSQGHKAGSILLGADVWVAANCVLSPGTQIEDGAIVGSGSVVSGPVGAFAIVAGHPARPIGKRGP